MMQRNLRSTALIMPLIAWGLFPLLIVFMVGYPHGFVWGIEEGTQWHPVWCKYSKELYDVVII